jgi:hypothetical protein
MQIPVPGPILGWVRAWETSTPALEETEALVVIIPHFAAANALCRQHEEIRNTRPGLFDEKHKSADAVTPDNKEDAIKHTPVLLLGTPGGGVAQGLMSAWREKVGAQPSLAKQNEAHVEARVDAWYERIS